MHWSGVSAQIRSAVGSIREPVFSGSQVNVDPITGHRRQLQSACSGPFSAGSCCQTCPSSHPYCSIDCTHQGQCAAGCAQCQCTCAGEACCYSGMNTIACPASTGCADSSSTGITISGSSTTATCSELASYCGQCTSQGTCVSTVCPVTCGTCGSAASHSHAPHSHTPHSHTPHTHAPSACACSKYLLLLRRRGLRRRRSWI